MPWNGSGQFNRTDGNTTGATVWDDARIAGRLVRSDDHDTHDEDIATGLENTVTRDGQNAAAANLPMGGFRHTNVDDAAARTDYASATDLQDQQLTHIAAADVAGTADAITLAPTPAIAAYAAGQRWSFVAEGTNTGATTIAVSGLATRAVQKLTAALAAGDITTGDLVTVEDDGTQFQLLTPARTPVLTNASVAIAALADGTDGELITWDASGVIATVGAGSSGEVLTSNGAGAAPTMQALDMGLPRSYLAGLGLSNNSGDATDSIDIAVGEARSDANDANLTVATVIGKDISASWAPGGTSGTPTGGLSSSVSLTNDTWYHVILGLVSGTAEVGFDTDVTGGNLVTDHSFTNPRRIGSVRRATAANLLFEQYGDVFEWVTPQTDYQGAGSTAGALRTLTIPPDIKFEVTVVIHSDGLTSSGTKLHHLSNPDTTSEAPSISARPGSTVGFASNAATTSTAMGQVVAITNTSSQIRERSNGTGNIEIHTFRWRDTRGRDD